MAIIQDWKIRATQARCEVSGEPFTDGESFFTCIFEDPESDGFLRRDYSSASWKEVRRNLDPQPYSFWKSTYKAPPAEDKPAAGEEASVEAMLRRFIADDEPSTENARYILALMLERKKILIHADTKETGPHTLMFYEHSGNGEVFIVTDPHLRLDEVETVQREVASLLAAEEQRLRAESQAGAVNEVADQVTQKDEDSADQDGEGTTGTEDEPVSGAGEETAESLGADSSVKAGGELAEQVDPDLQGAEEHEEPSGPDRQL